LSAGHAVQLAGHIDLRRAAPSGAGALAAGDTTYFCTADAEGNAVSGVQSINSGFVSGVMAVNTGILLNNRMSYWHLEHGHPNRLQPGRRVRLRHPRRRQPGANQSPGPVCNDRFRARPQQPAEVPRWTSNVPGQYANWPHDGEDALTIERRFPWQCATSSRAAVTRSR
jgi:gamma-glutamyltranspeptidase/glutathione hydrolase